MINRLSKSTQLPEMEIRIAGTVTDSIVDGPGLRFVVFTQGCPHGCKGCHNPETHDFTGGTITTIKSIYEQIMQNPLVDGVTFSGGEPFCQPKPLAALAKRLRDDGKTVVAYSGYTYEQLKDLAKNDTDINALLTYTNILIDGQFILEKRNILLKFRGSENQRVLDITCYPNTDDFTEMYK